MTNEDAFNAAKNVFSMYGVFYNNVAEKIGADQALELHKKTCEMMGTQMGQMTKEQMGIKKLDAKTAAIVTKTVVSGLGISNIDTEEKPTGVLIKVHGCPSYEGFSAGGLDLETIESMCREGSLKFMNALTTQIDPNASYQLKKFRVSPDDYCEEEITLRK